MKKIVVSLVGLSFVFSGTTAVFAETATGTTATASLVLTLKQQIADLQTKIEALRKAEEDLNKISQDVNATLRLIAGLRQGMTGDEVRLLQSALSTESDIYPEGLITGYYGPLTSKAVIRFQKKHGLEQVGNVGPKTIQKINEILARAIVKDDNDDDDDEKDKDDDKHWNEVFASSVTCISVPPGHLVAPGFKKKHGDEAEHGKGKKCFKLPPGIAKKLPPFGTTTPDTTAPVVSAVAVSGITPATATVSWMTSENANSKVYYSTVSPVNIVTASTVLNAALAVNHTLGLTNLTASTTYYFIVESKDGSGNTATSSQQSFTTPAIPDTTAPVISAISTGSIASTTANVSWNTSESATSKVYYGTTTPINLATALTVSGSTLLTSHSLGLSGLTASTTYYYIVESKDTANNTATSSQQSFMTLP